MEQNATTTFVEDSTVTLAQYPAAMSGVTGLSVSAVSDPSLAMFLSKPYLVSQTLWTAATTSNNNLLNFSTTSFSSLTIYKDKFSGYNLFRGTCCFKLVINAQPFQAGRLLMHVLPFVGASPLSYEVSHNIDLVQKTTHPSVELDCRDTTAIIEIPWVGPSPWYSKSDPTLDWGKLYVDVLSPLVTGTSGSTGVEVSLFIYFKDCEFAAPLVPQSGDKSNVSKIRRRAQKVSADEEMEDMGQGKPISTVLRLSSRVADIAAGVPLLSSIAAPASWVLRASADVASKLGWSKPNLTTPSQFMVLRPLHNAGNADGSSQAEPLAISADPNVSILPGFAGTDIDEMSWNYIKAIPSFLTRFTFNSATAVGTNIYSQSIAPANMNVSYSNGLVSPNLAAYKTYPSFCYVASAFNKYRGGVKMILKFVKTDYHSGRLLVTWTPVPNISTATTTANSAYSMRTIIDIRETTEVEIVLPYMLPYAWQQSDVSMGQVDVLILNSLQQPTTVASTIDVLVYYAAADDFDVAMFNSSARVPYSPQSGDKPNTKVAGVIGNDTSTIAMTEEFSIGEKFCSIKQLISRYSRVFFGTNSISAAVAFRMYPWAVGFFTGTPALAMGAMMGDTYSFFASGYALARGGMRYTINCSGSVMSACDYSRAVFDLMEGAGTPYTLITSGATLPNNLSDGSSATNSTWVYPTGVASVGSQNTANTAVFVASVNGIEVYLPQYTNNPSRLIPIDSQPAKISTNYSYQTVPFSALQWDSTATVTYKKIYRCAAEDAQLGYFIGFPALLFSVS